MAFRVCHHPSLAPDLLKNKIILLKGEIMEKQWGGKREGAGRKPTGRVRKTLWLTTEEYDKIRELLKKWRVK
jgi:hypothetical protein